MKPSKKFVLPMVVAGFFALLATFNRSSAPDDPIIDATESQARSIRHVEAIIEDFKAPASNVSEKATHPEQNEPLQSASLGAALTEARHRIEAINPSAPHSRGAKFFAANPGQRLRAWFSPDGVELASGLPSGGCDDEWRLGLRLKDLGDTKGNDLTEIKASGRRVNGSTPDGAIQQWFENKAEGIEHGFHIAQAPQRREPELKVAMAVEGGLLPRLIEDEGCSGIRFVDSRGDAVVNYTDLRAWDSQGLELEGRMEVASLTEIHLVIDDRNAVYPVTIDPLFANAEKRLLEESVDGDGLGTSVALDGNTVVIGAEGDSTQDGERAGSAYVFHWDGVKWNEQARLTASFGSPFGAFGHSVEIEGERIVVGSPHFSASFQTGSSYVFVRDGEQWREEAVLMAEGGSGYNRFGTSVAMDGDSIVVGAENANTVGGSGAGAAYVFRFDGAVWSQEDELLASDGSGSATFGSSVVIEGDTALVGAIRATTAGGFAAGRVYVYERSGTSWTESSTLIAPDGVGGDFFGTSMAISAGTVVVGAESDDSNAGSAYVFVDTGGGWNPQAKLTASDRAPGFSFGISVAISGNTALVGSEWVDAPGADEAGAAYVYVRSGTSWTEQAKLSASDRMVGDHFGSAVALSGDRALIGANDADAVPGVDSGAGYVFSRSGVTWSEQTKLTVTNTPEFDKFGSWVAVSTDTAVVGLSGDDTSAGEGAGSAMVFFKTENGWNLQAKLTDPEGQLLGAFGTSVAIDGDRVLVGSRPLIGVESGSALVFERIGRIWGKTAKISYPGPGRDKSFGVRLELSGDTALVKATGSAFVFVKSGETWTQQQKLLPEAGDAFDGEIALSGERLLIGAAIPSDTTDFSDRGRVYIFARTGTTWNQEALLTASDGTARDRFGSAVALSGDTALVGAWRASSDRGGVYVYNRKGSAWQEGEKLRAADGGAGDRFGLAVALSGDLALIGAEGVEAFSGAAYIFEREAGRWSQQARLTGGLDTEPSDQFGYRVAINDRLALVSTREDGTGGQDGSVYAYLIGKLPEITRQPISRTVISDQMVTFSVEATGFGTLRYSWRRNGFPILGEDGPILSLMNVQIPDQGLYDCVVSNVGGVVISAAAKLIVNDLSEFSQTPPDAPPDANGFVLVNIDPAVVGSGWRFVGEQEWRLPGVPAVGLTTSDRTVEFRPVPGYLHPPSELVGVVSGGAASLLNRSYYVTPGDGNGSLSITIKPDSLADLNLPEATRAQWRFVGETNLEWKNSGESVADLVTGNYLVECKLLKDRVTPAVAGIVLGEGERRTVTLTYFLEDPPVGEAPGLLSFEKVTEGGDEPFQWVGQIRSEVGSSSGFVVRPRVVATAGHVVFNEETLAGQAGLQWLFQRDRANHEPKSVEPRGYYLFDGYAASRQAPGVVPGEGTVESQHHDVAALYFLEDAGRGGASGYLASDSDDNEFLLSTANKTLVGYPVDRVQLSRQGRMHATAPFDVDFTRVPGEVSPGVAFRTYTTEDIFSRGGGSGGPLCVQFEGGAYYPAAVYLGGNSQTVVRAIDSDVIDLFDRADTSGNGGGNNTGGGITHSSTVAIGTTADPGSLKVLIEPAEARALAESGWQLGGSNTLRQHNQTLGNLTAGTYVLNMTALTGFDVPVSEEVVVVSGVATTVTFTYQATLTPLETWRQAYFGTTENTGDAADGEDPDKDGVTNIDEFAAGSDPNNSNDFLKVATAIKSGSRFTVGCAGKAGRTYTLQRNTTLSGTWSPLASQGPLSNDEAVSLSDTEAPAGACYYRIEVSIP